MSLACLAHVNFLLHILFDVITEQIKWWWWYYRFRSATWN